MRRASACAQILVLLRAYLVFVALLLGVASCKRTDETQPPGGPSGPGRYVEGSEPLGVCPSIPSDDATGARLQLAQIANDRGCPKVALAALEPVDARYRAKQLGDATFIEMVAIAAEARRQVLAAGQNRRAPPGLTSLYVLNDWVWTGTPGKRGDVAPMTPGKELKPSEAAEALATTTRLALDAISVLEGVNARLLDEQRWDVADGMELGLRANWVFPCTVTKVASTMETLRAATPKMRLETYQQILARSRTAIEQPNPAQLEVIGRALLWDCNREAAATTLAQAMQGYQNAGQEDATVRVAIDLLELDVFPNGRADDLVVGELSDSDFQVWAGREEAAAEGSGPWLEDAQAFDRAGTALTQTWKLDDLLPEHRLRLDLARAVVELRLRLDPKAALELASTVLPRAKKAKLADLADEARVVMAIAHAMLQDRDAALALLRALSSSFDERGAEGARIHLAQRLRLLAQLEIARGQTEPALILLEANGELGPKTISAIEVAASLTLPPILLTAVGRLEDAVLAYDRAIEKLPSLKGRFADTFFVELDAKLHRERSDTMAQLGGSEIYAGDALLMQQIAFPEVMSALKRNDPIALDRWVRPPGSTPDIQFGRMIGLLALGVCVPAHNNLSWSLDMIENLVPAWDELLSGEVVPGTMEIRIQTRMDLQEMRLTSLAPVAVCAATVGQPDIVRRLVAVLNHIGRLTAVGPLSPDELRMYRALELHARGKFAEAGRLYRQTADAVFSGTTLSGQSGVSLSELAAAPMGLAVEAALMGPNPDLDVVIRDLESMSARDLRVRRVQAATELKGSVGGEVATAEAEIERVQGRIRLLSGLAAQAQEPAVKRALERKRTKLNSQLKAAQQRHQKVLRSQGSGNVESYRALALGDPPTLAAIQKRLLADEVLVYYVLRPEQAWAIVVDRSSARSVKLPSIDARTGMPRLRIELGDFDELLHARLGGDRGLEYHGPALPKVKFDPARLEATSRSLYQRLFAPLAKFIPKGKRVLIVPGEQLTGLPLASIGGSHPLVARNPIRILPSAQLLGEQRHKLGGKPSILVVGDPAFDVNAAGRSRSAAANAVWRRLPGTRREAKAVAGLYKTKAVLGAAATEAAILRKAESVDILHIATHGLADATRPSYSAVVLSTPREDSGDGILHGFEVERLRLKANLVVLSACETGQGALRGSEGVMALDRAFLVAGADAVVSSLWLVDDDATRHLMTAFHTAVRQGKPADVALAHAMQDTRKNPKWSDPYYWAAFQLVGDGVR